MTCILDGKKLAEKICDNLKNEVKKYSKKPHLVVILANDNEASSVYVSSKEKKAHLLGYNSSVYKFDKNVTQKQIIELIDKLNKDNDVNAILVQLPLFSHLDKDEIICSIDPKKDVDGFHPVNLGKLSYGLKAPICCTPLGIVRLLKEYNIQLKGKNALIIGRSNIVGKPLAMLLTNEHATVTLAHSQSENLTQYTKNADIIICATGKKDILKLDMVKKDAVVVDVGIIKQQDGSIKGDVDFENISKIASYITPVPGGVGPMTIACLMENTFELFLEQNKINAEF